MNALAGIIVLLGGFSVAILLILLGFQLFKGGSKQETTIIKVPGGFELTLSTVVGGIFIVAALFIVVTLFNNFYHSK